ncbi:Cos111p [Lachancea thermotolerans CBS 6340]|uniref:KLTH0E12232p n=1 Tax=Lachancea thermotolerans (strain ATCC 56472 / CBS 6340 / NRRL Y-8284) TaxID=559295 RepID=C5DIG0_LACTC|nr:KLTH0E12232p [Lachancea thermotolerans CBS 6340]CAR23571.1 KLTH0E12232p [Lachancea thermotolerans CBS 6340]
MTGGHSHANQPINIVNSNYFRYGTSVYQKLYNGESDCSTQNSANELNETTPPAGSGTSADSDNTTSKFKRKYRSLLQNYGGNPSSKAKRFIGKLHDHGSSDSFSLFSLRSTHSNRNLPSGHSKSALPGGPQHEAISEEARPFADIKSLPVEILALVIRNFLKNACYEDARTLVRCLYVSRDFYEATKVVLYEAPGFTSTYRVAQFVTCLRVHPQNGLLVRHLDLSMLKNGVIEDQSGSFDDDEHSVGETRIPVRRRSTADSVLEEGDEEDDENERNSNRANGELERATTPVADDLPDIAWAGWRDWRYRFDPLYGNQLLSCCRTLKRVSSRSSSIHSNGTTGTGSASGYGLRRSHRSNSSVSSFTSSIMSSIYNSSSLSSLNLLSTHDPVCADGSSSWFNKLFSGKRTPKQKYQNYVKARVKKSESSEAVATPQDENAKTCVKFSVQAITKNQPYHERHPLTNKYLLKFALSKDLPLGYIFHLVRLCPNMTLLNLANLNISSDFEVQLRKDPSEIRTTSLLPNVQEIISDEDAFIGRNLEVIYLTDSSKGYSYYEGTVGNPRKRLEDLHFGSPYSMTGESWISSNYPPPIDERTKFRGQRNRHNMQNNFSLVKLEVRSLFALIHGSLPRLEKLFLDNVVWCSQMDVKGFVFSCFPQKPALHVSFIHAGMSRNMNWASSGSIHDFVAILILGEIMDRDDLFLEDLFNVRTDRYNYGGLSHDNRLVGRSNILTVTTYAGEELKCVLQIRRSSIMAVKTILDRDNNILCNVNLNSLAQVSNPSTIRIRDLTQHLTERLEDLRAADLRRHIGENQYAIH